MFSTLKLRLIELELHYFFNSNADSTRYDFHDFDLLATPEFWNSQTDTLRHLQRIPKWFQTWKYILSVSLSMDLLDKWMHHTIGLYLCDPLYPSQGIYTSRPSYSWRNLPRWITRDYFCSIWHWSCGRSTFFFIYSTFFDLSCLVV